VVLAEGQVPYPLVRRCQQRIEHRRLPQIPNGVACTEALKEGMPGAVLLNRSMAGAH
jgi:hypothetical protein